MQISWQRSISIRDFSILCGVPVAGDSYWSSRRWYAAATDFQILRPIGNKSVLFLRIQNQFHTEKFTNNSRLFLRHKIFMSYQYETDLSPETVPLTFGHVIWTVDTNTRIMSLLSTYCQKSLDVSFLTFFNQWKCLNMKRNMSFL